MDELGTEDSVAEESLVGDDRPLNKAEDIELDIREAIEELKDKPGEEQTKSQPTQEKNTSPTQQGIKEQSEEAPKVAEKPVQSTKDTNIAAPASWTVEGKQWFNAQPIEVKRELAKRTADMERQFHKVTTEAASIRKEYADVDEAIKPYLDDLKVRGIPRGAAIRNLFAANAALERDLRGGVEMICKAYGTTLEELAVQEVSHEARTNGHLQPLMERIQSLENELSVARERETQKASQSTLTELYAVRDETDSAGKYLRPELHDSAFVEGKINPVYQGIRQAYPELSPREALVKAYSAVTGKSPERERAQAEIAHKEKASKASLSVRGTTAAKKPLETQSKASTATETALEVARELGYI